MQLTYRGTHYNVAPSTSTKVDSGLTATYRGLSYNLLKSNAVTTLPKKALKYRGIVIGGTEATDQQVFRPAMA